jgi:hypothetical protein
MVAKVRVADHRESVKLLFGQKYGQELIDGRRRCKKLDHNGRRRAGP